MFDTVKNSLGSNWPQGTPTLNIEWGQIDPKGNRRVKGILWTKIWKKKAKVSITWCKNCTDFSSIICAEFNVNSCLQSKRWLTIFTNSTSAAPCMQTQDESAATSQLLIHRGSYVHVQLFVTFFNGCKITVLSKTPQGHHTVSNLTAFNVTLFCI